MVVSVVLAPFMTVIMTMVACWTPGRLDSSGGGVGALDGTRQM